jgi:hypothetical protein
LLPLVLEAERFGYMVFLENWIFLPNLAEIVGVGAAHLKEAIAMRAEGIAVSWGQSWSLNGRCCAKNIETSSLTAEKLDRSAGSLVSNLSRVRMGRNG